MGNFYVIMVLKLFIFLFVISFVYGIELFMEVIQNTKFVCLLFSIVANCSIMYQ